MTPEVEEQLDRVLGTDAEGRAVYLREIFRRPIETWFRITTLTPEGNLIFNICKTYRPEILGLSRDSIEKILNPGMSDTVQ